MNIPLKEVCQIRFGYYSQLTADSGVPYLQARQFDDSGNMTATPDTFLYLNNKSTTHLLNDGDVIFVGKGNKNFAWCYRDTFGPAVASTTFFVITPDRNKVIPEYLVAIFNHPKNQLYFRQLGAGSNIQSIRKNELEDFSVPVLPLQVQAKIIALYELHKQDINLTLQLLQRKNELYESVVNTLVNNN